jgi:hypothetical protein
MESSSKKPMAEMTAMASMAHGCAQAYHKDDGDHGKQDRPSAFENQGYCFSPTDPAGLSLTII